MLRPRRKRPRRKRRRSLRRWRKEVAAKKKDEEKLAKAKEKEEAERLKKEKAEQDKAKKERVQQEKVEKAAKEKAEKVEKAANEKAEKERLKKDKNQPPKKENEEKDAGTNFQKCSQMYVVNLLGCWLLRMCWQTRVRLHRLLPRADVSPALRERKVWEIACCHLAAVLFPLSVLHKVSVQRNIIRAWNRGSCLCVKCWCMHMGDGLSLQSVLFAPAIATQSAITDGDCAQKQLLLALTRLLKVQGFRNRV